MPTTEHVPTKLIEAVENDTAAMLMAVDAALDIELALRALPRRGCIDDDDMQRLERALDTVRTGVNRKLDYARWARRNPLDAADAHNR